MNFIRLLCVRLYICGKYLFKYLFGLYFSQIYLFGFCVAQFGAVLFVAILVPFFGWPFFFSFLQWIFIAHRIQLIDWTWAEQKWSGRSNEHKININWNGRNEWKGTPKAIRHNASTSWSKGRNHFVILAWVPIFRPRKPNEMRRKFYCVRIWCMLVCEMIVLNRLHTKQNSVMS